MQLPMVFMLIYSTWRCTVLHVPALLQDSVTRPQKQSMHGLFSVPLSEACKAHAA